MCTPSKTLQTKFQHLLLKALEAEFGVQYLLWRFCPLLGNTEIQRPIFSNTVLDTRPAKFHRNQLRHFSSRQGKMKLHTNPYRPYTSGRKRKNKSCLVVTTKLQQDLNLVSKKSHKPQTTAAVALHTWKHQIYLLQSTDKV